MAEMAKRIIVNTPEDALSSEKQFEAETGIKYADDYITQQRFKAWSYNKTPGTANIIKCEFLRVEEKLSPDDVRYYNCPICNNKSHKLIIDDNGNEYIRVCECQKIRNSLKKLYNSGLGDLAKKFTFDKYIAKEAWQKGIKELALCFTDEINKWFFIGGQVGSGKTFICTAIAHDLIMKGKDTVYMLWVDVAKKLKQNAMDSVNYQNMIEDLKNAAVLYIDDFLKTEHPNTPPSAADFNIAYEILNYRYNQKNLITIISSEYSVDQISNMSEAVGSRIYEKTADYNLYIKPDKAKNMRYKKAIEF